MSWMIFYRDPETEILLKTDPKKFEKKRVIKTLEWRNMLLMIIDRNSYSQNRLKASFGD